jgi:CHAT domain-containing protein
MISQPATPNLPRIPGTTKEVLAIKRLLQDHDVRVLCLEGEAATVNQGITNMETHSCIHFACHAHQNTQEPLKSKFMLHDGGLELSEIIKKHLVGADLAYLSACQTSTGDEKLSEEAVHLAAGMLAAGYRGVVATMWSISDRHGPQVAEDFYAKLISQDSKRLGGLSTDNAASALHYSTQKLRKQLGDSALDWIPYVHFGL